MKLQKPIAQQSLKMSVLGQGMLMEAFWIIKYKLNLNEEEKSLCSIEQTNTKIIASEAVTLLDLTQGTMLKKKFISAGSIKTRNDNKSFYSICEKIKLKKTIKHAQDYSSIMFRTL